MPEWLIGTLPLVGVMIGGWLNRGGDAKRWRRDWIMSQVRLRQSYYGDLLEAMYDQVTIAKKAKMEAEGTSVSGMTSDRITASTDEWRRQMARGKVQADPTVQKAVTTFDVARAHAAEAIQDIKTRRAKGEAVSLDKISKAEGELDAAVADVANAINLDLYDANVVLLPHVLTWRQRLAQKVKPPEPKTFKAGAVPAGADAKDIA